METYTSSRKFAPRPVNDPRLQIFRLKEAESLIFSAAPKNTADDLATIECCKIIFRSMRHCASLGEFSDSDLTPARIRKAALEGFASVEEYATSEFFEGNMDNPPTIVRGWPHDIIATFNRAFNLIDAAFAAIWF